MAGNSSPPRWQRVVEEALEEDKKANGKLLLLEWHATIILFAHRLA